MAIFSTTNYVTAKGNTVTVVVYNAHTELEVNGVPYCHNVTNVEVVGSYLIYTKPQCGFERRAIPLKG